MASPSLTARFDDLEVGEDQSSEKGMERLSDSESEGYELELESMTGRGIKRLCSELLELKKTSDEDFQKNIYSNYSAFLRIFEEVGGIEREIRKMKEHVSTQRVLVEELMSSVQTDINLDNLDHAEDESVEDLELDFPSWLESRTQNILETMDTLLLERRMEEALVVLEKETKVLQKLQKEKGALSTIINPFASVILDCRTRLAGLFTSVAEHKRVAISELHNALLGLCRVGEQHRASVLLLNFFHSQLENGVNELKHFGPIAYGTHILQLSKLVFSTVSQAVRSFGLLFGKASSYASGMLQWAKVEFELICHSFHTYVQSNTDTSLNLRLAVETVFSSFFYCSLLEQEGLILQPDLIKLIKPCILEVLQMHIYHLREAMTLSTTIDSWVLEKFSILGISGDKSSLPEKIQTLGYCQLTSSGAEFITQMQMFLKDAFLLHAFHLESFALKGVKDVFDDYSVALETAITFKGHVEESGVTQIISAQILQQKICVLANLSALVQLLPTVVKNSLDASMVSSALVLPEQAEFSSLKELDTLKVSIEEASESLRKCFCMQILSGIVRHGDSESIKGLDTCTCGRCITGSLDALMPSFSFQELFLLLRQLEEHCECTFLIEDGFLNSLNTEIMKIVMLWLSEKWQFFKGTKSHRQVLLDVHFLIEVARSEVQFPNDLIAEALNLVANINLELSTQEFHLNSDLPEEGWCAKAAKVAMETILEAEVTTPESCRNPAICTTYIEDEDAAAGTEAGNDRLNEVTFINELFVEDAESILEEESGMNWDLYKADSQRKIIQPLYKADYSKVDGFSFETLVGGSMPTSQIVGVESFVKDTDAFSLTAVGDRIFELETRHSNEKLSNAEDLRNDIEAQNEKDWSEAPKLEAIEEMNSSREKMAGDQGRGERKGWPKLTSSADRFKSSKATEKLKHAQGVDGLGKNIKGKTTRPLWQ